MPDHARIMRTVVFGTGGGWAGWKAPAERVRLWLPWALTLDGFQGGWRGPGVSARGWP